MKYTLLELVKIVLSSIDGDEVDSITETTEAFQVAYIIRHVYNRIVVSADLPKYTTVFNLLETDASTPIIMTRPIDVVNIEWIKYDNRTVDDTDPSYRTVKPLSINEFLDLMYQLDLSDTDVSSVDYTANTSDTLKILYRTDKHPTYYTALNDRTLIFDSYNSDVETYLAGNRSLGKGQFTNTFTFSDAFIPTLDDNQFELLVNEAKSWAAAELRQSTNIKAEQAARHGWINLQRTKNAISLESNLQRLPDYGRN